MRICLYLSLVTLIFSMGCASSGNKNLDSEWTTLKNSTKVECQTLKLPSSVIGIEDLYTIQGKNKNGLVLDVIERTGNSAIYSAEIPYKTDLSDIELERISFGSNVIIAGGSQARDMLLTLMVQKTNDKGDFLEIRSNHDNVVRFTSPKLGSNIIAAKATFNSRGIWIKYKEGDDETSVEDASTKILFAEIGKNMKLVPKFFNNTSYPAKAELVTRSNNNSALVFWVNTSSTSKKVQTFFVQELFQNGKVGETIKFNLETENDLESWTVTEIAKSYYLAYVDGDSLIGNAKVKVSNIDITATGAIIEWTKSQSLTNEHVSEPIWSVFDDQNRLLLPKWVDNEATIASYKVTSEDFSTGNPLGIFPKGIRVVDSFKDPETETIHTVTRYRTGEFWKFNICEL